MNKFIHKLYNSADSSSQPFPKIRIAAALLLLLFLSVLFVVPYLGYSDFAREIIDFGTDFQSKTLLVLISAVLSAAAIWAHKRWENVFTQISVIISFPIVVGSLLLYFYYPTQILGLLVVFSWGGATILLPVIAIIILAVAVALSWLISSWILPIYRYFTDNKILPLWLAIILALIAVPLLAQFLETGFVTKQSSQYQNYESDISTESYEVDDNRDLFSIEYTGRENDRYRFYGGRSRAERQFPENKSLTIKPERAGVSGEFVVNHDTDADKTYVQFRDSTGEVIYESGDVCAYDFKSPTIFSPDKTKYASQLAIDRACEDLFVYDATTKEAQTLSDPGEMMGWIDNEHALLYVRSLNGDTELRVYDTEEKNTQPIIVPYDRFSGGQGNPASIYELNADLHPGRSWLAVANTSPFTKSCEILLLNPKEKRQIVLTDLPLGKTCDGVRWQGENTLLLHEQGEGTLNRSGGKIYRLQFKQPTKIFSTTDKSKR